jgi:hypothetical protein
MMRDPNLVEARTANDLHVKPPHGRQTRVALGLEANVDDNTNASAYSQPSTSGRNVNFDMIHSRDLYGDRPEKDYVDRRQNGLTPSSARDTAQPSQMSTPGHPQALQRARSDVGPSHWRKRNAAVIEEDLWRMRHGWEDEYTSNEYLALLNSVSARNRQEHGLC